MKLRLGNRRVALAVLGCTLFASLTAGPASAGDVAILTSGSSVTPAGWSNLAWNYVGLAAALNTPTADTRMAGIRQGGGLDILYRSTNDNSYNISPTGITTTYSSITASYTDSGLFYAAKPGGGVDVIQWDGSSWGVTSPAAWGRTYSAIAATITSQPDQVWGAATSSFDVIYRNGVGGAFADYPVPGWPTGYTALANTSATSDAAFGALPGGGVVHVNQAAPSVIWSGTYSGLAFSADPTYLAAIMPGGGAVLLTAGGVVAPQAAWSGTYTAIAGSQLNNGQFFAAVVPEPSTYALLLGGVAAAAIVRRRRGRPVAIPPTRGNPR